jgi:hypothetical protein
MTLSLETNLNTALRYADNIEPYRDSLIDICDVLDSHDLLSPDDLDETIKDQKEQIEALEQLVGDRESELNEAYTDRDMWEDKYKDLVLYLSNNYDPELWDGTTLELMGEA